jgi:putative FMN-dependent luciferase-like monooxygenase
VTAKRIGFFTRVLDEAAPAERYRMGIEQIVCAERNGFDSVWIAQHHFNEFEGGMPAPLVYLAYAAAKTKRIRLGTGIITLPLEIPVRVAEDCAVLDLLSGGRLEVGMGPGGTPSSFAAFGQDNAHRTEIFERNLEAVRATWRGEDVGGANRLYPDASSLNARIWQATFTVAGGRRAGLAGDGLLLSRTQPRTAEHPNASLADIQDPIIDAYLEALPPGATPRILGSRSVFVADDGDEARRLSEAGLRLFGQRKRQDPRAATATLDELLAAGDSHVGPPADVIRTMRADRTLDRCTDIAFQVHSMDPPHKFILRSIELVAEKVAPALGWKREDAPASMAVAV